MTAITYRVATLDDVTTLAMLRWEMECERHPENTANVTRDDFITAFVNSTHDELARGSQRAWLAEAEGKAVSCALLIWWMMPPNFENLERCRGFVSSVYTRPTHRRQGISRHIMEMLISEAQSLRIQRLILWASDMGRPLYESLGFMSSRGLELNLPELAH